MFHESSPCCMMLCCPSVAVLENGLLRLDLEEPHLAAAPLLDLGAFEFGEEADDETTSCDAAAAADGVGLVELGAVTFASTSKGPRLWCVKRSQ